MTIVMKQNIKLFLPLLAATAFLYGCDNYESPYSGDSGYTSSIKLVSEFTSFPAAGGSATIEVSAPDKLTAETSSDWCHLSVDGMKINVEVDEATSRYGRSAIVVLRSAGDSLKIACMQRGIIFSSETPSNISSKNAGGRYSYLFMSNLGKSASTSSDWISASFEGDSLIVSIAENPDGKMRSGWVAYESGAEKDTINVSQLDIEALIPGKYEIPGYMYGMWYKDYVAEVTVELAGENQSAYYGNSSEGTNKQKTVTLFNVSMPHLVKSTNGAVDLSPVFQLAYNPEEGYLSWMTSVPSVNYKTCYYKSGRKTQYVFSGLVWTGEIVGNGQNGHRLVLPRNSFGHYNAFPSFAEDGTLSWHFKSSGLYGNAYSGQDIDGWGCFLNSSTTSISNSTKGFFYFVSKDMVMTKVGELE